MDMVVCPHCRKHRILTSQIPKDVVVVMPCPHCQELTVVFRNRILALSRRIIERGTFDERKNHIAHVIAMFLESGVLPQGLASDMALFTQEADDDGEYQEQPEVLVQDTAPVTKPITQSELDKFVRVDLKCIDNSAYFYKHFN